MNFPGYRLPDELLALRDQIKRVVRDEVIPVEQRIDPDAPSFPTRTIRRSRPRRRPRGSGRWARRSSTAAAASTRSRCACARGDVAAPDGSLQSGLRCLRPLSASGDLGRQQGADREVRGSDDPRRPEDVLRDHRALGRLRSRGAIQTRAEKRGDRWVLNGRKVFTSRAHDAPWGLVWARTDKAKGRGGISCFILERGTPGFTAKPIKVIRTSAIPNDVTLEDCEVPAENLVGAEGQGLDLAFELLVKNRFPYSACNLGVAVAAHRMAIAHAKQRSTFGAPLSQRQAIQWMLADAEVELRACRWIIWEGAWKADRGEDARVEASIAKLYSSEVLGRVIDAAVQIHGAYGVSKEFPLERWYREARVRRIGEGPSEVHRMVIARSLFR
jgi:acyl-CoA dehydrogenase